MIKVIFIAYYFPPKGGAGVQRSLKFVKHLRDFGIDPIVVTSDSTSKSKWAPKDDTLSEEVPEDIQIIRTPWPESKNNVYDIESQKAISLIEKVETLAPDAKMVFVTMSPFEDSSIAKELALRLSIPWIADLRDPWALDEFQVHRSIFHKFQSMNRMRQSLKGASVVIMNTPESAMLAEKKFGNSINCKITSITNGYDKDDFRVEARSVFPLDKGKLNIVHTGTFHTALGLRQSRQSIINRVLGRVDRRVSFLPRSPFYLLKALSALKQETPAVYSDIRVTFAGSLSPEDKDCIHKSGVSEIVFTTGYLDHRTSVSLLSTADALFFPMHAIKPNGKSTIVPGKAYEYMASRTTIIAAVPDGDACEFLSQSENCIRCQPDSISDIKDAITKIHTTWTNGGPSKNRNMSFVNRFERRNLTKELADIFKACHSESSK